MHKQQLPIDSELPKLNNGDKIYTVEFVMEEKPKFEFREFTFLEYIDNSTHIEGIETNEDSVLAHIRDERFGKIDMKTDLQTGFFLSKEDAATAFIDSIKEIHTSAEAALNDFYEEHGIK